MGRVIKNPKEIVIRSEEGITTVALHYGLSSEEYPDIEIRKGLVIPSLTPPEQTVVNQILMWATGKMNEHEGIS